MTNNREKEFYHFVQRAIDAEEKIKVLEHQISELQKPPTEPEPKDDRYGLVAKGV